MERIILITHTLRTEAVAKEIPHYLQNLQGIVTDTRRLTYGADPSHYLAVFYIGDLDHESTDQWVRTHNSWKFKATRFSEASQKYPHRKFTPKEFRQQEAQKHAERIEKKIGSLLS
jgi:hypothetical protein